MKRLLLLCSSLLLFVPQLVFATGAVAQTIEPPRLVDCKTPSHCDRDAQHLEAFVAGFYEWYVEQRAAMFASLQSHDKKDEDKIRDTYYQAAQKAMKERFTANFRRVYERAMQVMDGENAAPFCTDTDSDPVLCTIAEPDKWSGPVSAHLDSITEPAANLTVSLPEAMASGEPTPAYKLSVILKRQNGAWAIEKVSSPKP